MKQNQTYSTKLKWSKFRVPNWTLTKLRRLNWNDQSLEYFIELWLNLEGVICNLTFEIKSNMNDQNENFKI